MRSDATAPFDSIIENALRFIYNPLVIYVTFSAKGLGANTKCLWASARVSIYSNRKSQRQLASPLANSIHQLFNNHVVCIEKSVHALIFAVADKKHLGAQFHIIVIVVDNFELT